MLDIVDMLEIRDIVDILDMLDMCIEKGFISDPSEEMSMIIQSIF